MKLGDQVFLIYLKAQPFRSPELFGEALVSWQHRQAILVSVEGNKAVVIPGESWVEADFSKSKIVLCSDLFSGREDVNTEVVRRNKEMKEQVSARKQEVSPIKFFDLEHLATLMALDLTSEKHCLERIRDHFKLNDQEGREVARVLLAEIKGRRETIAAIQREQEPKDPYAGLKKFLVARIKDNIIYQDWAVKQEINDYLHIPCDETGLAGAVAKMVLDELLQQNFLLRHVSGNDLLCIKIA